MHVWEGVTLAMTQLRAEKLKSFFALLGVTIGVMFLLVVVSVIEGMDRYIRDDMASQIFGINTVRVRRNPEVSFSSDPEYWRAMRRRPAITYADADAVRERLSVPARVGVESGSGSSVVGDNGRTVSGVRVMGVSAEIFEIRDWGIDRGRAFTPQEAERGVSVVVLGVGTAEELFGASDPLGRTVRIQGFPYRVIGVIEPLGSFFGESLDNLAVAPARSAIQSFTNPRGVVDQMVVQTLDPSELREAQAEIEGIMRARRGLRPAEDNDFAVETSEETLSFWDRISRMLFIALPMLVGIALVVGGIVIMNIQLVSVMERTREIGVRKALGVVVGVTVGIVAGVYPAARAARLDPVAALRYE